MGSNNRSLLIGAMAALAVAGGAPAPAARPAENRPPIAITNRSGTFLDKLLGTGGTVAPSQPRYIKRPFHTVAEMKRKAIKAKNRRRHKLAMKRKH